MPELTDLIFIGGVMIRLTIEENSYACRPEESVLDVLLRENINISYACRKGTCHSCMARSLDTASPRLAQAGLKDTLKKQNHFLACQCYPKRDMTIKLPDQSDFYAMGTVIVNKSLNRNTILLIITIKEVYEFKAGQFVNLQRADGLTRSYSIANIPRESNTLEFHIRRLHGGRFSEWVHTELKSGDSLAVSEPRGHCFYLPERKEQGMLLVGTGTGLAPLAGILTDALACGHSGPIRLFHGSREIGDLYRIDEMRELARRHKNFSYTPCVSSCPAPEGFTNGRASDVALASIPDLKGWRIFLCGHPEMVNQTKKMAFLKGASLADIYFDAFLVSQDRPIL